MPTAPKEGVRVAVGVRRSLFPSLGVRRSRFPSLGVEASLKGEAGGPPPPPPVLPCVFTCARVPHGLGSRGAGLLSRRPSSSPPLRVHLRVPHGLGSQGRVIRVVRPALLLLHYSAACSPVRVPHGLGSQGRVRVVRPALLLLQYFAAVFTCACATRTRVTG